MATESKLVASDTTSFGHAVAVSGDYAIVGGRQPSSTSLVSPGQAHIFVFDGTTWTVQATLKLPTPPDQGDHFGEAVAVEGDTALVGGGQRATHLRRARPRVPTKWFRIGPKKPYSRRTMVYSSGALAPRWR